LGIPAVAVSSGGVSEWLRDGVNGAAVDAPASPEAFGDALAELLMDTARLERLRKGARRVAQEMSLEAHVDRLERTFDSVRASAAAHA
jgi:glycosyltransferase involved in cell wall biosynthesis